MQNFYRNAVFVLTLALCPLSALAQLEKPNDAGVSMGQIHLAVKDIDVQKTFWTAMGGKVLDSHGAQVFIQIAGAFIVLEQGTPDKGTTGSVINHFGIFLKDIDSALPRWKAEGISFTQSNPKQAMLTGPDGVMIEVHEDATMTVPIKMHHIHFNGTHATEMRDWYVKLTGAAPSHRATFDTANLPGVELAFSKTTTETTPLDGRSLNWIGFEVTSLKDFSKRLKAQGLKFDGPIRRVAKNSKTRGAFLEDPWGTKIEITENLAPPQS